MNTAPETETRLVSINVAEVRRTPYRGHQIRTGIFKTPVSGPVMVRQFNLEGDAQADLTVHGGLDKAVYVYAAENYALWQAELNRELPYGKFGENLTTTGLLEDAIHVDDVIEVGGVLLQVTEPRLPCFKLGITMGNQRFLKRFLQSGRSGFYCRVLREGEIEVGDAISFASRAPEQPTIESLVSRYAQE
jgi:MOSC domain-containing protein YiiM